MDNKPSPLKAIRKHCLSCSGSSTKEVRECSILTCDLFDYRFGKNPKLKGKRGKGAEFMKSMKKMRESKKTTEGVS